MFCARIIGRMVFICWSTASLIASVLGQLVERGRFILLSGRAGVGSSAFLTIVGNCYHNRCCRDHKMGLSVCHDLRGSLSF